LRQLGIYLNIWHIYGGPHLSLSLHIYKREERYQRIGSDREVGDTGQHVAQGGRTPDREVRGRERVEMATEGRGRPDREREGEDKLEQTERGRAPKQSGRPSFMKDREHVHGASAGPRGIEGKDDHRAGGTHMSARLTVNISHRSTRSGTSA
jgi:hypothetical protein